ncbi:hypothetical protein IFHNHDMJ_02139 [Synechococcus sp. CBW1107]|nr:hypothetical protein IFHNHDMJ_02139 [Synechococcus sp. CBW1107]
MALWKLPGVFLVRLSNIMLQTWLTLLYGMILPLALMLIIWHKNFQIMMVFSG